MKTLNLLGFGALLSMVACAAPGADGPGNTSSKLELGGGAAPGVANPASGYCTALGYELAGGQCAFPDGTSCDQWAFFRGECGQAHSFCNQHGGTVSNVVEDMGGWTGSSALCTLPTGASCKELEFSRTGICEAAPKPIDPTPACTPLPGPGGVGAIGLADPAAVYCTALGYELTGGSCTFPNGTSCDPWAFFSGECGGAHSFCNQHGGTISNVVEDMGGWTGSYAMCTLSTGEKCKEVTFSRTCSCQ